MLLWCIWMFIQRKLFFSFYLISLLLSCFVSFRIKQNVYLKHLVVFFSSSRTAPHNSFWRYNVLVFYRTDEIYFTFIKAQMEDENSGCEPSRGGLSFYKSVSALWHSLDELHSISHLSTVNVLAIFQYQMGHEFA